MSKWEDKITRQNQQIKESGGLGLLELRKGIGKTFVENTKDQTETEQLNFLISFGKDAIEIQEAIGQAELIHSIQMPTKVNDLILKEESSNKPSNKTHHTALSIYKKLGFKFITGSKGEIVTHSKNDDLFIDVVLPEGWKKEYTNHSMWSRIIDDKGRERMTVFYKASFYDREAFINLNRRYRLNTEVDDFRPTMDTYEKEALTVNWGVVKDQDNQVIFKTAGRSYKKRYTKKIHYKWWSEREAFLKTLLNEAEAWLNEHYPNHRDHFAYWD